MLPVLKRRVTKPRALLAALSRYIDKQDRSFTGFPGNHVGGRRKRRIDSK
ncbi:hypothetical protein Esi_0053_0013 [Ectocarpus siliculosus]|uniref:Uncharacterized protein n=1 Tax=Ectocarpus siliculosus TaxID=2880 RepID=D8LPN9_ECTSI|nr:hypothetical protein Esi_0053_0013 [Ectocarpus siliculosus]|eukprot:CBN77344.1 hypothetical protein Esi_0053_0013 [Ectocarpus siliculosus]